MNSQKSNIRLEDYAPYRAASEKLVELRRRFDAAEQEVSKLSCARAEHRDSLTAAAEALIAGGKDVEAAKDIDAKLAEAANLRDTLRRAIKLQEAEIVRQRADASRSICENPELKSKHGQLVAELARAIISLGKAAEAEERFLYELTSAGVHVSAYFRPMPFRGSYGAHLEHSQIACWLREAVVHGLIEWKIIPEPWLKAWGCYIDWELDRMQERANPKPKAAGQTPAQASAAAW